jgi:hypothetical protein
MRYTLYEDGNGDLYRVSDGISSGKVWMTVRIKRQGRGAQHRVKSQNLPSRDTRQEAQHDLDAWAKEKQMRAVGSMGADDGTAE